MYRVRHGSERQAGLPPLLLLWPPGCSMSNRAEFVYATLLAPGQAATLHLSCGCRSIQARAVLLCPFGGRGAILLGCSGGWVYGSPEPGCRTVLLRKVTMGAARSWLRPLPCPCFTLGGVLLQTGNERACFRGVAGDRVSGLFLSFVKGERPVASWSRGVTVVVGRLCMIIMLWFETSAHACALRVGARCA